MEYGYRLGCHQMAERSLFYKGYQFPVCARCTGVIVGEIVTILFLLIRIKVNVVLSILFILIMGLDWFIQYIKLLHSNNIRRVVTGFFGGMGLTYIYYYIIVYIFECIW